MINHENRNGLILVASSALYWILPGHLGLSLLPAQSPITPVSLVVIMVLILMTISVSRSAPGKLAFCLVIISALASFGIWYGSKSSGLYGKYYGMSFFSSISPERRIDSKSSQERIDQEINFKSKGYSLDGRYFKNFYTNDRSEREWAFEKNYDIGKYKFGVDWYGYIRIPSGRPTSIRLSYSGTATLSIDGHADIHEIPDLQPGMHDIAITYARADADWPFIILEWNQQDRWEPVPWYYLSQNRELIVPVWTLQYLPMFVVSLWLAGVILLFYKAKFKEKNLDLLLPSLIAASWFIYLLVSIKRSGAFFGYQILTAGNDPRTYEEFSREIVRGDIFSMAEYPHIFFNYGYRYLLSLFHLAAGEAPADVLILQSFIISVCVGGFSVFVAKSYNMTVGLLFIFLCILIGQYTEFSMCLLDTAGSISVSTFMLAALILYGRRPSRSTLLISSVATGVLILLRPNVLPFLLVTLIWVYKMSRKPDWRTRTVELALFSIFPALFISLLPLRTYIVSGSFQLLPDNGLYNLWIGNHPPSFTGHGYFTVAPPARDQIISIILEYAMKNPGYYFSLLIEKLLYIMGVDIRSGFKVKISVAVPMFLTLIGFLRLRRLNHLVPKNELMLMLLFLLSILTPLMIIFPWGYGWRLSGPSYLVVYLVASLYIYQTFIDLFPTLLVRPVSL